MITIIVSGCSLSHRADTMVMSSWASDVWTRVPLGPAQFWVDQACGEEFFGTMALALYAMEQHSSQLTLSREVHDCCQGLLHCLDIYASTNAHRLRALVGESVHVTFANDGFMDAACASVCRSLGALACELAPEFQAVARAAADRLGDIFDGLACFRNAAECLDVFRARVSESNKEAPLAALPTVSALRWISQRQLPDDLPSCSLSLRNAPCQESSSRISRTCHLRSRVKSMVRISLSRGKFYRIA